jgi:hypothetical protein
VNEAPRHHLNKHLDNIPDGATYGRHVVSDMTGNRIDFSKPLLGKQLDNIPDGATFGRVQQTALTGNLIDPSKNGFLPKGAICPNYGGTLSYTATTTSITWTWTGLTLYNADGSTTSITNGSQLVTGLSAGTTYYFLPFIYVASTSLTFSSNATPPGGTTGSPAIAYIQKSAQLASLAILQGLVPLASGIISASTPASGTAAGTGAGSGSCLRRDILVETKNGIKAIAEVTLGDEVLAPGGWQKVVNKISKPWSTFISIVASDGNELVASPTHPITLADGNCKQAQELSLSDHLIGRHGYLTISSLKVIETPSEKVSLTVEPEHVFFAGKNSPGILSHNVMLLS